MAFYNTDETLDIIDFCNTREELVFAKNCILEQEHSYSCVHFEMILDYIELVFKERSR
jgi:hypothetical protein